MTDFPDNNLDNPQESAEITPNELNQAGFVLKRLSREIDKFEINPEELSIPQVSIPQIAGSTEEPIFLPLFENQQKHAYFLELLLKDTQAYCNFAAEKLKDTQIDELSPKDHRDLKIACNDIVQYGGVRSTTVVQLVKNSVIENQEGEIGKDNEHKRSYLLNLTAQINPNLLKSLDGLDLQSPEVLQNLFYGISNKVDIDTLEDSRRLGEFVNNLIQVGIVDSNQQAILCLLFGNIHQKARESQESISAIVDDLWGNLPAQLSMIFMMLSMEIDTPDEF